MGGIESLVSVVHLFTNVKQVKSPVSQNRESLQIFQVRHQALSCLANNGEGGEGEEVRR